jgi:hypothetical protein
VFGVQVLIDEHVTSLDIATKIPPVSITAPDFLAKLKGLTSRKAKAPEMEHVLRFHIRKNFDEDPARYTKLPKRLDEIRKTLTGEREQLSLALEILLIDATDESGGADRPTSIRWCAFLWPAGERVRHRLEPAQRGSSGHRAPGKEIVVEIADHAGLVRFRHNSIEVKHRGCHTLCPSRVCGKERDQLVEGTDEQRTYPDHLFRRRASTVRRGLPPMWSRVTSNRSVHRRPPAFGDGVSRALATSDSHCARFPSP